MDCPSAFNIPYTGVIAKDKTKCWVTNVPLYNQCVAAAQDPNKNIALAKAIYAGAKNSWRQWGANTNNINGCHFN